MYLGINLFTFLFFLFIDLFNSCPLVTPYSFHVMDVLKDA